MWSSSLAPRHGGLSRKNRHPKLEQASSSWEMWKREETNRVLLVAGSVTLTLSPGGFLFSTDQLQIPREPVCLSEKSHHQGEQDTKRRTEGTGSDSASLRCFPKCASGKVPSPRPLHFSRAFLVSLPVSLPGLKHQIPPQDSPVSLLPCWGECVSLMLK